MKLETSRASKAALVMACLAGAAAATCGGKVVVDQSTGEGGANAGGAGNASSTGNTGNVGNSTNQGGVGNASSQVSDGVGPGPTTVVTAVSVGDGAGGASSCFGCADVIQGNVDPSQLCPESQKIFQNFIDCVCNFGCPMECGNACMGGTAGDACQMCLMTKCNNEFNDCFNDF